MVIKKQASSGTRPQQFDDDFGPNLNRHRE